MIRRIFIPLLATLLLAGAFGTLSGCNTVEGVGKDISRAGDELRGEAREHRSY